MQTYEIGETVLVRKERRAEVVNRKRHRLSGRYFYLVQMLDGSGDKVNLIDRHLSPWKAEQPKPRTATPRFGQAVCSEDGQKGRIVGMTPTHCIYIDEAGVEHVDRWGEVGLICKPPVVSTFEPVKKAKPKKRARK